MLIVCRLWFSMYFDCASLHIVSHCIQSNQRRCSKLQSIALQRTRKWIEFFDFFLYSFRVKWKKKCVCNCLIMHRLYLKKKKKFAASANRVGRAINTNYFVSGRSNIQCLIFIPLVFFRSERDEHISNSEKSHLSCDLINDILWDIAHTQAVYKTLWAHSHCAHSFSHINWLLKNEYENACQSWANTFACHLTTTNG